ncbi:MAG TPA: hypothetical protein P5307_17640, partial [Pirellulaceae bacterium]|nr:hypothetical protein [Pirellulaceae bacterium]
MTRTKRTRRLAALKKRRLNVEALEPRLLMTTLGDLEKRSLKEAFESLSGFASNLEQSELLNAKIPVLDKSISDVVDLNQLLDDQFLTPVEKFLEGSQPSLEDFQTLFTSGLAGIANGGLGNMATPPTILDQKFKADFEIGITKHFQIETDFDTQLMAAGVEASIGTLMTDLNFEFHLGASIEIDLSKIGGAPSEVVKLTLKDGTKDTGSRIVASVTSTLPDAEMSIGIAGAQVSGATFVIDVALPMDFGGNQPSYDFTLSNLKTTASNVTNVFGLKT